MEYGWSKILEKETTKSQARTRIKIQSNRMLNDLLLLAKQIPGEEVESYIPRKKIAEIMETLLNEQPKYFGDNFKFSPSEAQLANSVIQIVLKFFVMAYQSQFDNTLTVANLVTEQLQKTLSICKDIAYHIELNRNMKIAEKENMTYWFEWEELPPAPLLLSVVAIDQSYL